MTRLLLLFVLLAALLPAGVVPGYYIVELAEDPAASAKAGPERSAAVASQQERARAAVVSTGAEVVASVQLAANALVVKTDESEDATVTRARLEALPGVVRVRPVRTYKRLLDVALPIHAVPDAWQASGGRQNAGAGIRIGIIDTGIDSSHPGFQSDLAAPSGFPRGDTQFTNGKVIVARSYALSGTPPTPNDVEGHGTSVAFVAAGAPVTSPRGEISGVAPRAFLGNYKVFPSPDDGAPDALILSAIEDAIRDGMDVINLSLGGDLAGPPDDDILVRALDRANTAGIVVVVAAGNSGPDANTIGSPATAPFAISVGNLGNGRLFSTSVEVGGRRFQALAGSRGGTNVNGALRDVAALDPTGLACVALPGGSLQGRVALILRGTCTFEEKLNNVQAAGAVAALVYTDEARPEPITMEVGVNRLPAMMVSYLDGLDVKAAAGSGQTAALDFSVTEIRVSSNRVSSSSSRGPSIDFAVKPEVLAVGSSVYTARNGGGFRIVSGTSFSSPMMAGAAAVLRAARPGLTAPQYKSLLVNYARPLIVRGASSVSNSRDAGGGVLQLLASITARSTITPASLTFGTTTGTADLTREITVTNLSDRNDTFTLLPSVRGTGPAPSITPNTVSLGPRESQRVNVRWNVSGLAPGEYQGTIVVTGSQTSLVPANVPWWFGVPSQTVQTITQLLVPETARPNSEQDFYIRLTDAAGIPVTNVTPQVLPAGGTATVTSVSAEPRIPGTYDVRVRMGATAGTQSFTVTAGSVEATVIIPVQ
ncbi:MAG: S8 family serine peptidase [Bryobacteraceae bacterium]|nr:S8 family serine peptidase [Bryobacteraceae bacterium]